jgi:hypothetical protein
MAIAPNHPTARRDPAAAQNLPPNRSASDRIEALIGLEYHALMGVPGGDEPAHDHAFVRDVGNRDSTARLRRRRPHHHAAM